MPRPYLGVEITHPSANLVGADPRTMSFHRADDATGERGLGGGGWFRCYCLVPSWSWSAAIFVDADVVLP